MRNGFQLVSAAVMFAVIHFFSPNVWAQEEDTLSEISNSDAASDVDQIAAEIEKKVQKSEAKEAAQDKPEKEEKLEDFSGLGKLAPFSEISVIQKRFLPKTGRFQFFGGLATMVNDPWFSSMGFDLRFGYHFTEAWGVELNGIFLSNSQRPAAKDLYDQHGVKADSFVTTKGYSGGSLVWTPIYGKMGYFNRRIIPFDMYFQAGGGQTQVDNGSGGSTIHFGTGQIFALSKGMGFRWDFTWNSFSATPTGKSAQNFNNLLLTFGASFFFPEAKYR